MKKKNYGKIIMGNLWEAMLRSGYKYASRENGGKVTAKRIGVPYDTFRAWMCGNAMPTHHQLEKICRHFRITLQDFCFGDITKIPTEELSYRYRKTQQLIWE